MFFQLFVIFEGSELHLECLLGKGDRTRATALGCRVGKICKLNDVHDIIISPAIYSLPFTRPSNI